MTRIVIVCEGETEKDFCNQVLAPYLSGYGIYLQCPLIKKTTGGISHWSNQKKILKITF